MAILYHFHGIVGTATGNCAGNTHHPSCDRFIGGTETACNRRSPSPVNRPCRCVHEVPDDFEVPEDIGFDVWMVRGRGKSRRTTKHPKGKKKVAARKR